MRNMKRNNNYFFVYVEILNFEEMWSDPQGWLDIVDFIPYSTPLYCIANRFPIYIHYQRLINYFLVEN